MGIGQRSVQEDFSCMNNYIYKEWTIFQQSEGGNKKSQNMLYSSYKHKNPYEFSRDLGNAKLSLCVHKARAGLGRSLLYAKQMLSVTEMYSGVEGLDITMRFYFLVTEKRAMLKFAHVWMRKVHSFLVFPPEKKLERQVFLVISFFLEGEK